MKVGQGGINALKLWREFGSLQCSAKEQRCWRRQVDALCSFFALLVTQQVSNIATTCSTRMFESWSGSWGVGGGATGWLSMGRDQEGVRSCFVSARSLPIMHFVASGT